MRIRTIHAAAMPSSLNQSCLPRQEIRSSIIPPSTALAQIIAKDAKNHDDPKTDNRHHKCCENSWIVMPYPFTTRSMRFAMRRSDKKEHF